MSLRIRFCSWAEQELNNPSSLINLFFIFIFIEVYQIFIQTKKEAKKQAGEKK